MSCISHKLLYIWTYLSQNIQILHEIGGILDYFETKCHALGINYFKYGHI